MGAEVAERLQARRNAALGVLASPHATATMTATSATTITIHAHIGT